MRDLWPMNSLVDASMALFAHALALAIGVVLLGAVVHKLRGWSAFRAAVADYRLLPDALVAPAAVALCALEAIAGIALLVDGLRIVGASLAIAAIGVATAAVTINVLRGRTDVDCGCGGIEGRQPLSWGLVARNGALLVALAAIAFVPPANSTGFVAYATLAAATLALATLYGAASQLLANRSHVADLASRS
ncbi:MAG TPA: MauE/DoxX family redox-associated membrane protein [Casimicrobiaceae bacterium]